MRCARFLLLTLCALPLAAHAESPPPGRWTKAPRVQAELTPAQQQEVDRLEALGYLAGTRPASTASGVLRHDAERSYAGLNLVVSGHAPEARLLDMEGREVHRWALSFAEAFPEDPPPAGYVPQVHYWRRAYPLPDGSLLAIFEGLGLIKLDRASGLVWASRLPVHHDLVVLPGGEMIALTRAARMIPWINHARPVLEDFVSRLGSGGNEIRRTSLIEAFRRSPMSVVFEATAKTEGDILHTNSLYILDGARSAESSAFSRGNVLVSMRELNTLAVVDLETESVVWAHQSDYYRQHDARPLPGGNLLLLDNGEFASRVLEMDPVQDRTVWSYTGTDDAPFFTATCGLADRLPNGNTLITESDPGRALEVTPDGTIVWEYRSPHRVGERDELVATLFEMRRLPPDYGRDWLDAPGTKP
ncbi:MAG: hypothetical protein HKN12_04555 [Gemmatimonadetes bacterium]|nr:hypothetical protein [Gemmatimonadota bacterium]